MPDTPKLNALEALKLAKETGCAVQSRGIPSTRRSYKAGRWIPWSGFTHTSTVDIEELILADGSPVEWEVLPD